MAYDDDDNYYTGCSPCRRCGGPRVGAAEKRHTLGLCALCDPKGADDEVTPCASKPAGWEAD